MIPDELAKKDLITIDKDRNLEDAMKLMDKKKISRLIVTEKKKIIGILSEEDITRRLENAKERKLMPSHIHVSSAMTSYLRVLPKETDLIKVAETMLENKISSILITDGPDITGLITKTDLIKTLKDSKKEIADFYAKKAVTVSPTDTLVHVDKILQEKKIRRVLVVKDGVFVGIVTERDMARGFEMFRKTLDKYRHPNIKNLKVENVMTSDPMTVKPNAKVSDVVGIMLDKKISGIPVVDRNTLGVITKTDLVRGISERKLP